MKDNANQSIWILEKRKLDINTHGFRNYIEFITLLNQHTKSYEMCLHWEALGIVGFHSKE